MVGATRRRGSTAATLLALLATIALVSCTTPDAGRAPAAPGTTAGTAPTAAAATGPTYAARPCPFPLASPAGEVRVSCGALTVPESRATVRSGPAAPRTIELAVARLSSPGAPPGATPLVYLEGGPGGSALAGTALWTDPVSPLLRDRDVILVDQRGTGYSRPRLTCDPELADPASDELSDAELNRACHGRLTASGIELGAYDTVESAHDVEDLRVALGIDRWSLLGVSYGTRLALEVMRLHPGGIEGVVLDSVYPPGVRGLDEQPTNGWTAMHALLDDCRADPACDRAFPDLERRFLDTIDRLDRDPVVIVRPVDDQTDEEVEMTGRELVHTVFDALYSSAVLPDVPKALDAAARGDLQRADDLLAGVDIPGPASGPADDAPPPADEPPADTDGLFLTIACAEDAPGTSDGSVAQASGAVPGPVRRALVGDVADQLESCRSWPVPERRLEPVRSDIPTLLLAGSNDPITPPRWARLAAQTLSRSTVIEVRGAGHGAIDAGPCATQAIVGFLASTTSPAPPAPACDTGRPFST